MQRLKPEIDKIFHESVQNAIYQVLSLAIEDAYAHDRMRFNWDFVRCLFEHKWYETKTKRVENRHSKCIEHLPNFEEYDTFLRNLNYLYRQSGMFFLEEDIGSHCIWIIAYDIFNISKRVFNNNNTRKKIILEEIELVEDMINAIQEYIEEYDREIKELDLKIKDLQKLASSLARCFQIEKIKKQLEDKLKEQQNRKFALDVNIAKKRMYTEVLKFREENSKLMMHKMIEHRFYPDAIRNVFEYAPIERKSSSSFSSSSN